MAKLKLNGVLIICTGNICRSPIGERLLRRTLPSLKVDSAGTYATKGEGAHVTASQIASRHGLSLEGHVACRLTPTIAREYDLLLVMESEHIEQVTRIAPETRGKILFFGQWIMKKEIPDPYRKNAEVFELVYGLLEQASYEWAKRLS